jgi:hypothetical protein
LKNQYLIEKMIETNTKKPTTKTSAIAPKNIVNPTVIKPPIANASLTNGLLLLRLLVILIMLYFKLFSVLKLELNLLLIV